MMEEKTEDKKLEEKIGDEHLLSDDVLSVSYKTLATKKNKPFDPEIAALDLARGIHKFLNDGKEPSLEALEHYKTIIMGAMMQDVKSKGDGLTY